MRLEQNANHRGLADCKSNYEINYSSRVADVLINNDRGVQTKIFCRVFNVELNSPE